jgi:hypothetical protein
MKRNVVPKKFFLLLVVCLNSAFVYATTETRWVGLDLGQPYVITKVGLALHQTDGQDPLPPLGIIEGANQEDFMDALPLYIVTHPQASADVVYFDIQHSKGFRYVRYVSPAGSRCDVSELTCYGQPGVGDDTHLYQLTNLPTVTIHTLEGKEPYDKIDQIPCSISILSTDKPTMLSEPGTIRLRGNASINYPKKPYRIKFDEKQQVLDAPAKAKKWTLINNYGDKTLMRNLLAFGISKKMKMPYTPYGTLVDVMVNGEYKGTYQLCDQVQVHKGRIEITEMTPEDNEKLALTGGYHFEVDAYARFENSWFKSAGGKPVTIHTPDEKSITSSQRSYIESYFNTMEGHWRKYLDLNTFVRHFLVGEMSGNTDTYYSVHMYKDRGSDVTYVGPVWDFDLAFENDERTYPINEKTDFIFRNGGSCAAGMKDFVSSIIDDEDVRQIIKDIWYEVRSEGFNEDFMLHLVDSLKDELRIAQKYNFIRWPILNQHIQKVPVIWGSYDEEVENVRRYIKERFVWMDNILCYNNKPDDIRGVPNNSQSMQIYTIYGVYCGNNLNSVKPGVYIIKQGKSRRKVIKK